MEAPTSISGKMGNARLIGGAIFLVALACLFGRDLLALIKHAAGSEIHSHIVLVPFISAYLIYIQWQQMPRQYRASFIPGILFGLAGLAAWVTAHRLRGGIGLISYNDYLALITLALVLLICAGGFLFLGLAWMRAAAFAMSFLLFAIPLPDHLVEFLENASKLGSAEVANAFFSLSGTPMYREGLVFQLPGIAIEVAQECSGIRSSWVLFITSLLASHMFLKSPWRRAVLVLCVIPLGLLRNGFRILVIGMLCVHLGPEMINSMIHRKGGPLFFALSLVPLFLLLRWLRRGENRPAST